MPYSLELHEDGVKAFIRNLPGLSREGRVKLFANLDSDLREKADAYRVHPGDGLPRGRPCSGTTSSSAIVDASGTSGSP
jgi:hypothetical protein